MMSNKLLQKIITLSALVVFGLLIFMSCEDFQDEDFNISSLDLDACHLLFLHDTSTVIITTPELTEYDTNWVNSAVDSFVTAIVDSLENNNITVASTDTTRFKISSALTVDTNYVALVTEPKEIVFFIDDFVEMNIFGTDGNILNPIDETISLETAYHVVSTDTTDDYCSKAKVREVYNISENKSLIQLIKTDQMEATDGIFHIVILNNR